MYFLFVPFRVPDGVAVARRAAHDDAPVPLRVHDLGDSKNTVGGYCLDIPRFEESLNN